MNKPDANHNPYAELTTALHGVGFTQDASEYHGALCGALCIRKSSEVDPLAVLDGADANVASNGLLSGLRDKTLHSLKDSEGGVKLLLPDDDTPLSSRARALGEWCEGFLYGLASNGRLDLKKVSPELREVVEDFTQFTRATFDEADNAEIEEEAYAQLVEYVRVGLQLIFMELSPRIAAAPKPAALH